MIRVVLDANVLASGTAGLGFPSSVPGELLRRWRRRAFVLIVSEHLIHEFETAMGDPYFRRLVSPERVGEVRDVLRRDAIVPPATVSIAGVASHPEDDLVLVAAVSAEADFLVTGDRELLQLGAFRGVRIVSPRDFLAVLEARPPGDDPRA